MEFVVIEVCDDLHAQAGFPAEEWSYLPGVNELAIKEVSGFVSPNLEQGGTHYW